jgi:hypothetical protein
MLISLVPCVIACGCRNDRTFIWPQTQKNKGGHDARNR